MNIDIQTLTLLIVALAFFIAGTTVPTYYGIERLRGTGRWMADRLPYKPPPGESLEEQMEQMDDDSGGDSGDSEE